MLPHGEGGEPSPIKGQAIEFTESNSAHHGNVNHGSFLEFFP